jgi:predicted phosphodiesterase
VLASRAALSVLGALSSMSALAAISALSAVLALAGCPRAGQERALRDLDIGVVQAGGVAFTAADGLGHFVFAEPGSVTVRASAPVLDITAQAEIGASGHWRLTVINAMPDGVLTARDADGAPIPVTVIAGERPTIRGFELDLPEGAQTRLRFAPPDADVAERYRFAVMGDIQTGLDHVHEVFAVVNRDPTLRFVVSTGDLVEDGLESEYERLIEQLATLDIPYFSTIGNHELFSDSERWSTRFGRFNTHFAFKGAVFTVVDSGNAALDPLIYDWLEGWLDDGRDGVHLFFTHFPAVDPFGIREGAFRSRKEASKLLAMLAAGAVDTTFYGHIHSYYAYENAGIPAFISGGAGALPEQWDGIGRHFLAVTVTPERVEEVALVRVD